MSEGSIYIGKVNFHHLPFKRKRRREMLKIHPSEKYQDASEFYFQSGEEITGSGKLLYLSGYR